MPDLSNPQAWNRYAYVVNNPVNLTDPSGNAPICDEDGYCFDRYGKHRASIRYEMKDQTGYPVISDPGYDPEVLEENLEEVAEIGEVIASVLWEPADWASTIGHCAQGDCSAWALVGLIPFIPGGVGRYADDLVEGGIKLVGQNHHLLTTKIMRAVDKIDNMKGVLKRDDLIVQAVDVASHRGYQAWHRAYDDIVVEWLETTGKTASPKGFLSYLRDLHLSPGMQQRFPYAVQRINNVIEALP